MIDTHTPPRPAIYATAVSCSSLSVPVTIPLQVPEQRWVRVESDWHEKHDRTGNGG